VGSVLVGFLLTSGCVFIQTEHGNILCSQGSS
jgi:hypothetical protein